MKAIDIMFKFTVQHLVVCSSVDCLIILPIYVLYSNLHRYSIHKLNFSCSYLLILISDSMDVMINELSVCLFGCMYLLFLLIILDSRDIMLLLTLTVNSLKSVSKIMTDRQTHSRTDAPEMIPYQNLLMVNQIVVIASVAASVT